METRRQFPTGSTVTCITLSLCRNLPVAIEKIHRTFGMSGQLPRRVYYNYPQRTGPIVTGSAAGPLPYILLYTYPIRSIFTPPGPYLNKTCLTVHRKKNSILPV
jgi:hypothetical protein